MEDKDTTIISENQEFSFSFFKGPISNCVPEKDSITVEQVYTLVASEELKVETNRVRSEPDENKRRKLKEQLPYVTFAGIFSYRNANNIIKRSGLFVVDIDHISKMAPPQTIDEVKQKVLKSTTPVLYFVSPSGDGLKVVHAVDVTQGEHEDYYYAFEAFYSSLMGINIDKACKDISRACFVCHDSSVQLYDCSNVLGRDFLEAFPRKDTQGIPTPVAYDQVDEENIESDQNYCAEPEGIKNPLDIAAFMIRGSKDGKKHSVLLNAARLLGGFVASGEIYRKHAEELLEDEIRKKDNVVSIEDALKTIQDGLNYGARAPLNSADLHREEEDTDEEPPHASGEESRQEPDLKPLTEAERKLETLIHSIIVDPDAEVGEPPTVLSVNQIPICTLGSFSLLIGKAKTRKTFFITAIAAATISGRCNIEGLTGSLPPSSEVHYFDTEQSKYHLQRTVKRIVVQAGYKNFTAYEMRPFTPKERLAIIEHVIGHLNGAGFIIIDGLRDLLTRGINDEGEATDVISKLLKWTHDKNCHIMLVLHQNKGDDNARGHIGTEAVNKAETVLTLTVHKSSKDVTTVTPGYSRNIDFEPFSFRINDQCIPETVHQLDQPNADKNYQDLVQLFTCVMQSGTSLRYTDIMRSIMETENVSKATAKRRISVAEEAEIITKTDSDLYQLTPDFENEEVSV